MTRLTIVSNNVVAKPGLLAEHGFACWVETDHSCTLFDTGQGMVLEHNAHALDIDLSQATSIALSHGHYDHTGGLPQLLGLAPDASIYAHPDFRLEKFSRKTGANMRNIGPPELNLDEERFVPTPSTTRLPGGLWLTGTIPRIAEFEDVGGIFYHDDEGNEPDSLRDDQALFFRCGEGLVILLGCAHSGVINTVMHICELAETNDVHAIIGGMHLVNADSDRIKETTRFLKRLSPRILAPTHCTGSIAQSSLSQAMPAAYVDCPVGTEFILS